MGELSTNGITRVEEIFQIEVVRAGQHEKEKLPAAREGRAGKDRFGVAKKSAEI
jgi:hypothetical protein